MNNTFKIGAVALLAFGLAACEEVETEETVVVEETAEEDVAEVEAANEGEAE